MHWAYGAARDKDLDSTAMLVFLGLADHANTRDGRSWPGAEMLAGETGFTEQTVRRAMQRIRKSGVVPCIPRPGMQAIWLFPYPPREPEKLSPPRNERPGSPSSDPGKRYRGGRYLVTRTPVRNTGEPVITRDEPAAAGPAEAEPGPAPARVIDVSATIGRLRDRIRAPGSTLGPEPEVVVYASG